MADLDKSGHAEEIGARDTVHLLAFRHRLDLTAVRRDLKLATALAKYELVTSALPMPDDDATDRPLLHLEQARAIVTSLEAIPTSAMVPTDDLIAAEEQLVKAAEHLTPTDLYKLGKQVGNVLYPDPRAVSIQPAHEPASYDLELPHVPRGSRNPSRPSN